MSCPNHPRALFLPAAPTEGASGTPPGKGQLKTARNQRGVAAVEFALVASIFFMLLIGAMEMGRVLFYWNTTAEATRLGARIAVVCSKDANQIFTRMSALFPTIAIADIDVTYLPGGCTVDTCESVTVTIKSGKSIPTFIPYAALNLTLPPFTTTLPRESMQSIFGGTANPICQ